jgi:hypothetical protein
VTRHCLVIFSGLVMSLTLAAQGQQRERPKSSAPQEKETPAVDPDVEKFKHAIDVQASEEQARKFRLMLASTAEARGKAQELQQQAVSAGDVIEIMHRATTLEDDLDQALTDYRIFRRSLSDPQDQELKKLMTKLVKSVHAISKDADSLSQQVQRIPVNTAKLGSLAEHLEKELSALQSAQMNLRKEMNIQPE